MDYQPWTMDRLLVLRIIHFYPIAIRIGYPNLFYAVYAVGDLIDTPQLAHVGYAEAILVVKHFLGENPMPIRYDRVPWAIYCHPEVAWAGLGEEAAREAGFDVVVAKHQFRANSRAHIIGEIDGLVKVVAKKNADGSAGQVLGVHMVGPWVTEQLSGGYLAVNWEASVSCRDPVPVMATGASAIMPFATAPEPATRTPLVKLLAM